MCTWICKEKLYKTVLLGSRLLRILGNDAFTHELFLAGQVGVFGVEVSDGSGVQLDLVVRVRLRFLRARAQQQQQQHCAPHARALHGADPGSARLSACTGPSFNLGVSSF